MVVTKKIFSIFKKIDIHWDFWGENNQLDAIEIVFKRWFL